MDEEQGDGVLDLAPLMEKVDIVRAKVIDGDLSRVLREIIVEIGFGLPPGIIVRPVVDKAFDVSEWNSTTPRVLVLGDVVGRQVSEKEFLL